MQIVGKVKNILEKRIKIFPLETPKFLWIVGLSFILFFGSAIFRNYVDTAFLKRYGTDAIPTMLIINAVFTIFIFGAMDRILSKYSDILVIGIFVAFFSVAGGACFIVTKADISIVYPILYQLCLVLDSILFVHTWNIAGELFDPRQGKRIFPMVTAAQLLGAMLGNFVTRPFTSIFGEDPALLLFSGCYLLAGFYIFSSGSRFVPWVNRNGSKVEFATSRVFGFDELRSLLRRYPIARYLLVTGLAPNIVLPIFLYQFSVIVNHSFNSEQALINFLSLLRGITSFASLVVLLSFSGFYSRIKIPDASIVYPLHFTFLFSMLLPLFNVFVASAGQFFAILIQRAVAGPVNKILFGIIPRNIQTWSKTFLRGSVPRIGTVIGSLLMIGLRPFLTVRELALLGIGISLIWLLETFLFRSKYKRILKQVILEDVTTIPSIVPDRTFHSSVIGQASAQDMETLWVRPGLRSSTEGPGTSSEVALSRLDSNDPDLCVSAIHYFGHSHDPMAVRKLVGFLGCDEDRLRGAAIEALTRYPRFILPFLEASLLDSNLRVRQGILEVIRLSYTISEFETAHLLEKALTEIYTNLIFIRRLRTLEPLPSAVKLARFLEESNEDTLRLIFFGLWVYHSDMRLLYQKIKIDKSAVAIELIENSIRPELSQYIIPLIEDIPLDEKIARGRELLLLINSDSTQRVITLVALAKDPLMKILAAALISDLPPDPAYIPILQISEADDDEYVRETAHYALAKMNNEDAMIPNILHITNKLRHFSIFEGMGVRELHAIATVAHLKSFQSGDEIVSEGRENSSIYLIISGRVKVFQPREARSNERLGKLELETGGFIGFVGMFTNLPPNVTCEVIDPTETLVLPQNEFQEIMRIYPQIAINLCRFCALKFREFLLYN